MLPRWGTGARNGLSVSTSKRSSGQRAAAGAHVGRVLERDDAAERHVEAGAQTTVDLFRPAREAVQHRALWHAFGVEHVEEIVPRVACVDDQREVMRVRQRDLGRERGALRGAW